MAIAPITETLARHTRTVARTAKSKRSPRTRPPGQLVDDLQTVGAGIVYATALIGGCTTVWWSVRAILG